MRGKGSSLSGDLKLSDAQSVPNGIKGRFANLRNVLVK